MNFMIITLCRDINAFEFQPESCSPGFLRTLFQKLYTKLPRQWPPPIYPPTNHYLIYIVHHYFHISFINYSLFFIFYLDWKKLQTSVCCTCWNPFFAIFSLLLTSDLQGAFWSTISQSDITCLICHSVAETDVHLLFQCAETKKVWKVLDMDLKWAWQGVALCAGLWLVNHKEQFT